MHPARCRAGRGALPPAGRPARAPPGERGARAHDRAPARAAAPPEVLVDLSRPDESWWLSFATDTAAAPVAALLEHPGAYSLPAIGRAFVPLDERSLALMRALEQSAGGVQRQRGRAPSARRSRLRRAPVGCARRARAGAGGAQTSRRHPAYDVEFRRDRRGEHWILISPRAPPSPACSPRRADLRAPRARRGRSVSRRRARCRAAGGAARALEDASVDPRVRAWLARARTWRGNVEVAGPSESPVFVLLGEERRLPRELRGRATSAPDGATHRADARLLAAVRELDAWVSPAARRCIAALEQGRPPLRRSWSARGTCRPHVRARCGSRARAAAGVRARCGASRARGARPRGRRACTAARRFAPTRSVCPSSTHSSPTARCGWSPRRSRCCRRSARSTLTARGWWRYRAPPMHRCVSSGWEASSSPSSARASATCSLGRRAFLADEQGLGKTIEALAALEAAGAYPAVVVSAPRASSSTGCASSSAGCPRAA